MKNIIWLASYPKSGNTWFRVFLANLLSDSDTPADINLLEETPIASSRMLFDDAVGIAAADLTHKEIDRLRPEVYEYLSNQAKTTLYLKIHDACTLVDKNQPLVPPAATRGALYFVRNPLDIAVSFANHSNTAIDRTIKIMNNENYCFCDEPGRLHNQLRQQLLSWSSHVLSWINAENIELLTIKYEDMINHTMETFSKAATFLGLSYSAAHIENALTFSHINELRRQEKENGFQEKFPSCKSFFSKGESGYWRNILNSRQVDTIISQHKDVMKRFGYLNEKNEPVF
ncbi:MAG: sulfotransferase domain-containing protein [bacterium]|nr:sulfotransferase domain-containing protein [bacterium]